MRVYIPNMSEEEGIVVKIKTRDGVRIPEYATEDASCMDIRAFLGSPNTSLTINPGETKAIPTGIFFEVPSGYEIVVRPRSGLALDYGITVLNSPGTIDADFRGEVKIILHNTSNRPFIIHDGDRIAQIALQKVHRIKLKRVSRLSKTQRGSKGLGSTGID